MADYGADEVLELSCGRDPGADAAALKRKLDLYCAAVAKSMEAKSQESSLGYPNSQASDTSQLISQASNTSQLISQASFDGDGDGASLFRNSDVFDNAELQAKPANSGTSDDDGDLDENTDPANTKKMRRMLSNRESARRSRKRKQVHLNDIESQVSSLIAENESLLKRLADMTQKYKNATFDNRNLIVDVETMRRKVNIAEEAVRRLTGTTLMLSTTSDTPTGSMPFSSCTSDAASGADHVEESLIHLLHVAPQDDQIKADFPNASDLATSAKKGTMSPSLRRVESLEKLQKRIYR